MPLTQYVDLESKKYNDLRAIAKELGLKANGTKVELIARIKGTKSGQGESDVRRLYKELAKRCQHTLSRLNKIERDIVLTLKASAYVKNRLQKLGARGVRVDPVSVPSYPEDLIGTLERWAGMTRFREYRAEQVASIRLQVERVLTFFREEITRLGQVHANALQHYDQLNGQLEEARRVKKIEAQQGCLIS